MLSLLYCPILSFVHEYWKNHRYDYKDLCQQSDVSPILICYVCWNQTGYILCSRRRSSIQSAKTRLGADCGSDHELLIDKFRIKLKKVTIRPFRYDLNQIPYDYTVEVTNRFKGLDLIDRVPDELWTEVHDPVQERGIRTIPKEKKCKKAKW